MIESPSRADAAAADSGNAEVLASAGPLYLVCRVGDDQYAIPAAVVVEIETFAGATRVPGTPSWVIGLAQVRSRVIPAIDLRARFGLPAAERSFETRIVLVQQGIRTVGLVVDSAHHLAQLSALSQVPILDIATLLAQEWSHGGPGHQELP